jgi:hypothetical protein
MRMLIARKDGDVIEHATDVHCIVVWPHLSSILLLPLRFCTRSGLSGWLDAASHNWPLRMVDDKYIGLGLAVSGTVAIGTSFIITKKVRRPC